MYNKMTARLANFFNLETAPYIHFHPVVGSKDALSMRQNMKPLIDH